MRLFESTQLNCVTHQTTETFVHLQTKELANVLYVVLLLVASLYSIHSKLTEKCLLVIHVL